MFYHGLLDNPVRIGTTVRYELLDDGLYAEAEIFPGEYGDAALRLLEENRAAASSGTMPHLVKKDGNGYVSDWPLVEWSILDVDHAGSWPGTTTVAAIRSAGVAIDNTISDTVVVERSIFMPPANQNESSTNGSTQPHAASSTPRDEEIQDARAIQHLTSLVESLTAEVQNLRNAPAVQLPQTPAPPQQPQVQVKSKYDDVSLFGLLHWDEHRRIHAAKQGKTYVREESFMRALVDKARKARESQADEIGVKRVDALAFEAWHDKVPYLRADEAMQSTLAGSGDELVPTLLNSTAYYEFRLQSRVLALFPSFQMPSNPFDYPTISDGPRFRRASEPTDRSQTDLSASYLADGKPTTAKKTFSAGEIGVISLASRTFFEDAGLSVADVLAEQFSRNAARDIDYLLLNGDERTAATNISHSADPSGTEYDSVLALDGLRRIAQSNSDNTAIATLGTTSIVTLMQAMGTRGIIGTDLANLALVVDPGTWYKLIVLDDFTTVDLVGERATILTGQVGYWFGVPVIVSDELEYTDANGLYPAAHNGTKGQSVLVHRRLNMVGYRRDLQMESGFIPHTGLYALSATVRMDLQSMEAGSVAWGYNTTV